jgi:tetratricopeptide (TPR) repeat protein
MKPLLALALLFSTSTAFAEGNAPPSAEDKAAARAKDREGLKLLRKNDYEGASEDFAQATELDPSRAIYHNHYGLALLYEGDPYSASGEFKASIDLGLSADYTWNNLGMAYEHMDQLDDARAAYRKADKLGSPVAAGHLHRLQGVKSVYPNAALGCGGDEAIPLPPPPPPPVAASPAPDSANPAAPH